MRIGHSTTLRDWPPTSVNPPACSRTRPMPGRSLQKANSFATGNGHPGVEDLGRIPPRCSALRCDAIPRTLFHVPIVSRTHRNFLPHMKSGNIASDGDLNDDGITYALGRI